MSKKISMFLFACTVALGASFAQADTDSCYATCVANFNFCLSRSWLSYGYCSHRNEVCFAACDGVPAGQL